MSYTTYKSIGFHFNILVIIIGIIHLPIGHLILLFVAVFTFKLPGKDRVMQILKDESDDAPLETAAWYLALRCWLPALLATTFFIGVMFSILWYLLPMVLPNLYQVAQWGIALAHSPMAWIYPILAITLTTMATLKWGRQ